MTALLLALTLAVAGADTTAYVTPDTTSVIRYAKLGVGESVVVPTDSTCARCGKVCVLHEVICPGESEYRIRLSSGGYLPGQPPPCYARRCPDHGRHVEWVGSPVYASRITRNALVRYWTKGHYTATSDTVYNDIVIADSVEIGLREDGTVVWRKVGKP